MGTVIWLIFKNTLIGFQMSLTKVITTHHQFTNSLHKFSNHCHHFNIFLLHFSLFQSKIKLLKFETVFWYDFKKLLLIYECMLKIYLMVHIYYIYIIVPEGKQKMELERPVTPIDVSSSTEYLLWALILKQTVKLGCKEIYSKSEQK